MKEMQAEIEKGRKLIRARDNKYQKALNDVINNAGTAFKCKNDSFYLLQELVDMYSMGELKGK